MTKNTCLKSNQETYVLSVKDQKTLYTYQDLLFPKQNTKI